MNIVSIIAMNVLSKESQTADNGWSSGP